MDESNVGGMLKRFFEAGHQVDSSTSAFAPRSAAKADFMLVTCIDYRYPHIIDNFMRIEFPGKLYDHLSLAGASLAASAQHTGRPEWAKTFIDHVDFAIKHHDIERVLILDHRTCGAYAEVGVVPEAEWETRDEQDKHDLIATAVADMLIGVFHSNGKPGTVVAFLTPKVSNPNAPDFPTAPQFLCERTT